MTTYATLREANIARQAAWGQGKPPLDLAFCGVEFAGEAGEVCNVIKKLERERLGWKGSTDTVEHLAEEIADAEICLDLIAMRFDIDIAAAVAAKFNATSEKIGLPQRLSPSLALKDVIAERRRQQAVEGWTPEHDAQHVNGEMAVAAGCYALWDAFTRFRVNIPSLWPWAMAWWKPKDRRRNLVRAAALLVAEIERLDRAVHLAREADLVEGETA